MIGVNVDMELEIQYSFEVALEHKLSVRHNGRLSRTLFLSIFVC